MTTILLGAQCATYLALGGLLIARGQWKLGAAQVLLAGVQALIYS